MTVSEPIYPEYFTFEIHFQNEDSKVDIRKCGR